MTKSPLENIYSWGKLSLELTSTNVLFDAFKGRVLWPYKNHPALVRGQNAPALLSGKTFYIYFDKAEFLRNSLL